MFKRENKSRKENMALNIMNTLDLLNNLGIIQQSYTTQWMDSRDDTSRVPQWLRLGQDLCPDSEI